MWELVSFALIHEITHWVSVSDLSSSSWWNKRIPWNSTRPMWLCLCRGKLWLWGKPCNLGPLPIQAAAPLGVCCGFLPLYTLVSFQDKLKHTGRWCTLVCVSGWGWAAHQAAPCSGTRCLGLHCCCAALLLSGVFGCSAKCWRSLLRGGLIYLRNKTRDLFSTA